MLIVIAGFPGAFIHAFFTGALLIETIFSLDGLGYLSFESVLNRDYAGGVRESLYLRAGRARREPDRRRHLHAGRSAHRFRDAGGLRWTRARRPPTDAATLDRPVRPRGRFTLSPLNQPPLAELQGEPARLCVVLALHRSCSSSRCSPSSSRTTSRSWFASRARASSRSSSTYPESAFGGEFETAAEYRDPYLQKLIAEKGGHDLLAAGPLFLRHAQSQSADAGALEADLDADRGAMQAGRREDRRHAAARTSSTTGSAPTIRAAISRRG